MFFAFLCHFLSWSLCDSKVCELLGLLQAVFSSIQSVYLMLPIVQCFSSGSILLHLDSCFELCDLHASRSKSVTSLMSF